MRGRTRESSGFSLVELVLVLTIVAVMAALAAPRFASASAKQRVNAAANRIEADLALAQTLARADSASVAVTYAENKLSYTLSNADATRVSTTHIGRSPYGVKLTSVDFAGTRKITFNGFGVPDHGGTITVSDGRTHITLTINPTTGKVTRS